jgi:hypothetical protein
MISDSERLPIQWAAVKKCVGCLKEKQVPKKDGSSTPFSSLKRPATALIGLIDLIVRIKLDGLTLGITRCPSSLQEFESLRVGGRVHAVVGRRD